MLGIAISILLLGLAPPLPDLRISPGETVRWTGRPPGGRGVLSSLRVREPRCYGVQIDGTSFSSAVVFTVDLAR